MTLRGRVSLEHDGDPEPQKFGLIATPTVKCGCSSAVEHFLAKEDVEGSIPFARSKFHGAR